MLEAEATNSPLYVRAATYLGLRPVILSADPSRYDYLIAANCEAIRVDTSNIEAMISACTKFSSTTTIAGITSAQESVYPAVGKLCKYFSLPGPQAAAVERCCDKFVQRQILAAADIPVPTYGLAANATEAERCAAEIGFPVVVKPATGIGSMGVRLCRDVVELAEHTASLLGEHQIRRSPSRILVEQFANGDHYTVEMVGGDVIGIGAADFGRPPHFVCREYVYPALLDDEQRMRIVDVSQSCLRALGLDWGPTNIDLRLTKGGPVVIEVNPRLAALPNSELIRFAYGIDPVLEHIKLAIGKECRLRPSASNTAAARVLVADRDGTLNWIQGDRRAKAIPGVADVKLFIKPNTSIVRKGDCRDRIGYVIAVSRNPAQAIAALERATELIKWSITPSSVLANT
ncbi:ATP-grasp domain-containing protein [Bradyrhizobium sp. 163]|uniref:ATP-grasp domain-containing protein n=1 Tax=unclassified Bradyrhizobium TaxID=2631580 RepID=UPI003207B700